MTAAVQWEVGQEVILREPQNRGSRDTTATITRIARKYVYVAAGRYGRERAFDKTDGVERTGPNDSGYYAGRIFTPESLAEHDRRSDVLRRLDEATRGYGWASRLSTDDAETILRIVEGAR